MNEVKIGLRHKILSRRAALRHMVRIGAAAMATDIALLATACAPTTSFQTAVPVAAKGSAEGVTSDAPLECVRADIVYDVTGFGAKGDGVTDDTAAIQATINAVPTDGGTVWFPAGTYIVSPTQNRLLAIKSNLHFAGCGETSTLKIRDNNGDWSRLFSPRTLSTSVSNVTFESLTFDANIRNNSASSIVTESTSTWQVFIYVTAGDNIHVRDCRFVPCSGVWAVSLVGRYLTDCSVTGCYFQFVMRDGNPDYDNSMVYVQATNYTLSNNLFETEIIPDRGGRACMEAHGGPATVEDNTSRGFRTGVNITNAYYVGGSLGDVVCRNNSFTDAMLGILLWPTVPNKLANVTITNNRIELAQARHRAVESSGIAAYYVDEAKTLAAHLTITGNTIRFQDEGAGRYNRSPTNTFGIGLHNLGGAEAVVIDNNTIELSPASGILIGNADPGKRSFRYIHITNNTILNPGQNVAFALEYRVGIYCFSTISELEIVGNTISDTFPAARCVTAIAFDPSSRSSYTNIRVRNNSIRAVSTSLHLILPRGVKNDGG